MSSCGTALIHEMACIYHRGFGRVKIACFNFAGYTDNAHVKSEYHPTFRQTEQQCSLSKCVADNLHVCSRSKGDCRNLDMCLVMKHNLNEPQRMSRSRRETVDHTFAQSSLPLNLQRSTQPALKAIHHCLRQAISSGSNSCLLHAAHINNNL